MFQGRNLMVSHQIIDGDDFLSPRRTSIQTQTWAKEAMLHYKGTGCKRTREELILYYMDTFVSHCARRIAGRTPRSVEIDDLTQSGYFALHDYIDKFDLSLNYKFESFARLRVEGAMRDFLRREDPCSRLTRSRSKMIAQGIEDFTARFGKPPTNEELRVLLQLDEKEFLAVMKDVHVPCTLSYHPTETDNDTEGSLAIRVEAKCDGYAKVESKDLHAWLYKHLEHYDLLIVTLTYTEGLTMHEIGCVLGYSESRVSQRLKQVHNMLKARLLDHPEELMLMAG
jgi:RNA polymerase sigma factor for flagellar operon FliA